jgi:serine/threonine protein phosphatase 1
MMVTKNFKVHRCQRLPANAAGRDFVVGDLHGHRSLLEQELERQRFDPQRDRVLSVGDLIDRGPESLATLSLIEEPWFHAVLGNHELMLLNFLHSYGSRVHSRKSYPTGAGAWIGEVMTRDRKRLARLAERVAQLPLAIHVEGDAPFNVTHADLPPTAARPDMSAADPMVCIHKADRITSSRSKINAALNSDLLDLRFADRAVWVSPTPLTGGPVTYAGHSRVREVTIHNSYIYIDQGVCARPSGRQAHTPPTVLDHGKFAYWLGGVAAAQGRAAEASAARLPLVGASGGPAVPV